MKQQEGPYGNSQVEFAGVVQWSQRVSCFTSCFWVGFEVLEMVLLLPKLLMAGTASCSCASHPA